MSRKVYRTKLGRFTTRGRYLGARKREKAARAKARKPRAPQKSKLTGPPERKPQFRRVFKGRAYGATRGYSILVSVLVPGVWDTGSEPIFDADAKPGEQYHLVYWSTRVSRTVKEVRARYKQLIEFERLSALQGDMDFSVLASELRLITTDGDMHVVTSWVGTKIPKRLMRR